MGSSSGISHDGNFYLIQQKPRGGAAPTSFHTYSQAISPGMTEAVTTATSLTSSYVAPGSVSSGLVADWNFKSVASVASIVDASGNGHTLTAGSPAPTIATSYQNGRNVLVFPFGTLNLMTFTTITNTVGTTVAMVCKLYNTGTWVMPVGHSTLTDNGMAALGGLGATMQISQSGNGNWYGSQPVTSEATGFHIIIGGMDTVVNNIFYLDNVSLGPVYNSGVDAGTTFAYNQIGVGYTVSTAGWIGQIAMWNRILTPTEAAAVYTDWHAAWGTSY